MKNYVNLIIVVFLICILQFRCTDPNAEVVQLEEEVIAIHDEVMPKMTDIHQLKKGLQSKLSPEVDSNRLLNLILELEQADEAMMSWMDQYDAPDLTQPKEQNMLYLNQQKEKMIEVKNKMLTAITAAQSELNE